MNNLIYPDASSNNNIVDTNTYENSKVKSINYNYYYQNNINCNNNYYNKSKDNFSNNLSTSSKNKNTLEFSSNIMSWESAASHLPRITFCWFPPERFFTSIFIFGHLICISFRYFSAFAFSTEELMTLAVEIRS